MLAREHMIESVRALCHTDPEVVGALMYGSFAKGEGDRHSDSEFWLFFGEGRERVQALFDGFCHWALVGARVLARGEFARALDALSHMQRDLLWRIRLREGRSQVHWATPSRGAKSGLSTDAYSRLQRCAATLDASSLAGAHEETRAFATEFMEELSETHAATSRGDLLERLPQPQAPCEKAA